MGQLCMKCISLFLIWPMFAKDICKSLGKSEKYKFTTALFSQALFDISCFLKLPWYLTHRLLNSCPTWFWSASSFINYLVMINQFGGNRLLTPQPPMNKYEYLVNISFCFPWSMSHRLSVWKSMHLTTIRFLYLAWVLSQLWAPSSQLD